MSGVSACLNFARNNGNIRRRSSDEPERRARSEAVWARNQKVYLASDGDGGRTRRLAGRGARPPSPHLVHVKSPAPKYDCSADVAASEAAEAARIEARCDDLERLVVRKCVAKQPLHQFSHKLSTCTTCTTDVRLADGRTNTKAPGSQAYAHVSHAHAHAHRPNPRLARVVKGPGQLEPDACRHLARSTTWRGIDDMAGAGRLGTAEAAAAENGGPNHNKPRFSTGGGSRRMEHGPMRLPTQRSTGRSDLRRRLINYFGYFDEDEVLWRNNQGSAVEQTLFADHSLTRSLAVCDHVFHLLHAFTRHSRTR